MNKKYKDEDIRKGFENLARLRKENNKILQQLRKIKLELATYKAKEVGLEMVKMGFNNREALAAISMLHRIIKQ